MSKGLVPHENLKPLYNILLATGHNIRLLYLREDHQEEDAFGAQRMSLALPFNINVNIVDARESSWRSRCSYFSVFGSKFITSVIRYDHRRFSFRIQDNGCFWIWGDNDIESSRTLFYIKQHFVVLKERIINDTVVFMGILRKSRSTCPDMIRIIGHYFYINAVQKNRRFL